MAMKCREPYCRRILPNENSKDGFYFLGSADGVLIRVAGAISKGKPGGGSHRRFNRSLVSIVGEHFQFYLDRLARAAPERSSSNSLGGSEIQGQPSDRRRVHGADVQRSEFCMSSARRAEYLYPRLP